MKEEGRMGGNGRRKGGVERKQGRREMERE